MQKGKKKPRRARFSLYFRGMFRASLYPFSTRIIRQNSSASVRVSKSLYATTKPLAHAFTRTEYPSAKYARSLTVDGAEGRVILIFIFFPRFSGLSHS